MGFATLHQDHHEDAGLPRVPPVPENTDRIGRLEKIENRGRFL
jgi:hypothetical protein